MQTIVVNIIREVVEKVNAQKISYLKTINPSYEAVRYDYGHPSDLVERLVQYNATNSFRFKKYPLIGLFLDIPQSKGVDVNVESRCRLNMFIAISTQQSYKPEERTQNSFIPILYPLLDELLKQLGKHPRIVKPAANQFAFEQIDRYQWGKGGLTYYANGKENVFSDYIDAIEISGLELDFIKC